MSKYSTDCFNKLLLKSMVRQHGSIVQHGIDKRQGAAKRLGDTGCKLDKRYVASIAVSYLRCDHFCYLKVQNKCLGVANARLSACIY